MHQTCIQTSHCTASKTKYKCCGQFIRTEKEIKTFRTLNNTAISSRNNTINIQAHIKIEILHTAVVENLQLSKELMLF